MSTKQDSKQKRYLIDAVAAHCKFVPLREDLLCGNGRVYATARRIASEFRGKRLGDELRRDHRAAYRAFGYERGEEGRREGGGASMSRTRKEQEALAWQHQTTPLPLPRQSESIQGVGHALRGCRGRAYEVGYPSGKTKGRYVRRWRLPGT
eukprot:763088-Hanusia_phi.AAC.6